MSETLAFTRFVEREKGLGDELSNGFAGAGEISREVEDVARSRRGGGLRSGYKVKNPTLPGQAYARQ